MAAEEAVGLIGEQPRQLGRIAAQQHRLTGGAADACSCDALVVVAEVVDGVADDGGGVSLLLDRFEYDWQVRAGAERV